MKINRQFLFILIALIPVMLSCNPFPLIVPAVKNIQGTNLAYIRDNTPGEWRLDFNRSPWLLDTKIDYTKITPGFYLFQVQEKDANGNLSRTAESPLKVLSPWYKTWWAFLLYIIGFVLLLFLVVKWREIKLAHEKQKLEEIIEERTKEIKRKMQLLEKENLHLKEQSEKLKEMDMLKSRFFENISSEFRTPLTLIMGPLEQMLANSRDAQQKNQLGLAFRHSKLLLNLVNQLLELSRFDSGKMKLQASYRNIVPLLKGILSSFTMVAVQNGLDLGFHHENEDISLYLCPFGKCA
jgi:signal transduction histidine kinase